MILEQKRGTLNVNYSDRLLKLLKEIAHFYNTIDQQMLPCQQALMLGEAVAFERLVIPKKTEDSAISKVTWENPKELEDFIVKLQAASDRLASHNRSNLFLLL
uniref:DHC_N1 domain-containing protein n=1 Tax=Heterorhabditis bacteriophora TaxID=37862 RepID=A0A1I7WK47_HETBA